jgi:hypothetical protein
VSDQEYFERKVLDGGRGGTNGIQKRHTPRYKIQDIDIDSILCVVLVLQRSRSTSQVCCHDCWLSANRRRPLGDCQVSD